MLYSPRVRTGPKGAPNLQHVTSAYAPGRYLLVVDEETPELFREALRKLKDGGAELVEIDAVLAMWSQRKSCLSGLIAAFGFGLLLLVEATTR